MSDSKVQQIRSDLKAEATQLRAELWGLCNGTWAWQRHLNDGPDTFAGGLSGTELSLREELSELAELRGDRDAAWARCEALESKLEIERLTARVCATEAVEVQSNFEERTSEFLEELAAAESENSHLRQLLMRQELAASQSAMLREIHSKVVASLYQGEELKQQIAGSPSRSVRGSAMTPLQPCEWFETQGTPCAHQRHVSELVEQLHRSQEELRESEAERLRWARRAEDLEAWLAELQRQLQRKEEQTSIMVQEHEETNKKQRQSAEELTELRALCQHLESTAAQAVQLHHSLEEPKAGAKLRHAIRCSDSSAPQEVATGTLLEPVATLQVPTLPPPKVVRMVERTFVPTATLPYVVREEVGPIGYAPQSVPKLQSFLDASVASPEPW